MYAPATAFYCPTLSHWATALHLVVILSDMIAECNCPYWL